MDEAAAAVRLQRMQTTDEATDQAKEIKTLDEKAGAGNPRSGFGGGLQTKAKAKGGAHPLQKAPETTGKEPQKGAARGDSRGYRKGHFHLDKGSGEPPDRKRERTAVKAGSILHKRVIGQEEAVSSVARAMRRGRVGLQDRDDDRFVFVPRPHRCWKDGAFQGAGRSDVWFRKRADPRGHVGIYGRALCFENDRLASGLCRL